MFITNTTLRKTSVERLPASTLLVCLQTFLQTSGLLASLSSVSRNYYAIYYVRSIVRCSNTVRSARRHRFIHDSISNLI